MIESRPKIRRLQYSLRTLLLFVTVVAFGCVAVPPLWARLSWWLHEGQIKDKLDAAAVAIALLGAVVAAASFTRQRLRAPPNPMRRRFTVPRGLLWLTLLVAMAVGWWLEVRQDSTALEKSSVFEAILHKQIP